MAEQGFDEMANGQNLLRATIWSDIIAYFQKKNVIQKMKK